MNKKMIKMLEEQDKHFLYTFVFSIYKEYGKFQYCTKGDDYTSYEIKKDDINVFKICNDLYGAKGIYKFLNNKKFFIDNEVFLRVNNAYIYSGIGYEGFFYTLDIKKEVIMKAIAYFDKKSIGRILKEEVLENTNKRRRL